MGKYLAKPPVYEFYTFDEFVYYGLQMLSKSIYDDGMPYSFKFNGFTVTLMDDDCYKIYVPYRVSNMIVREAEVYYFTRDQMISGNSNGVFLIDVEEFNKKYYKLGE